MLHPRRSILGKPVLAVAAAALALAAAPAAAQGRFVGFYTEWSVYGHDYLPADIPADSLTHIDYAFLQLSGPDAQGNYDCAIADTWAALQKPLARLVPGTDSSAGENLGTLAQLRRLRAYQASRGKSLALVFSLGGASSAESAAFAAATVDAARRAHLIGSCIGLMQQQGFDGLDVDWEQPATAAETAQLTALLAELRSALPAADPATGAPYLLTVDGAAGYYMSRFDVAGIAPSVDWVNVLTYDFAGCWGMSHTGYNSPLLGSADDPDGAANDDADAVQAWIAAGLPAAKVNLGLPYFGHSFQALQDLGPNPNLPGRYAGIDPARNGGGTCAQGTWSADGTRDYWDLAQHFVNVNGYTAYTDTAQRVNFLYRDLGSDWISYDDTIAIGWKVDYAAGAGLGGIFAWELSEESAPGAAAHPLTDVAAAHRAGERGPYFLP